MLVVKIEQAADGEVVAVLSLRAKVFRTGRVGFWGQSKIELEGYRYQVQTQMVRLGPVPVTTLLEQVEPVAAAP